MTATMMTSRASAAAAKGGRNEIYVVCVCVCVCVWSRSLVAGGCRSSSSSLWLRRGAIDRGLSTSPSATTHARTAASLNHCVGVYSAVASNQTPYRHTDRQNKLLLLQKTTAHVSSSSPDCRACFDRRRLSLGR